MHYLIITSEFPPGPGGIGKHAWCMAKALENNGVTVTVVCNMDHTNEAEIAAFIRALPIGIDVHRIKRNGFVTYLQRIATIFNLNRKQQFDKVIVTGQFSIWMGMLLNIFSGKKVTAFVHGSELFIGGSIKRYFTKQGLECADKICAVSHYTAALTRKIVNKDIDVLPNGLDITEWQCEKITHTAWHKDINLLTVGSVTSRKGQQNVVAALPELIKKYPGIHYHIAGMPVQGKEITDLAERLNVQHHITIHGKLSHAQLIKAYRDADVFIMLSEATGNGDIEGFGIAVLEANIMGVPAIGSKNSGIADAIKDGYNGYLVDPKNDAEIIAAVDKILKIDRESMAANCRQWAYEHDWNELAKALL